MHTDILLMKDCKLCSIFRYTSAPCLGLSHRLGKPDMTSRFIEKIKKQYLFQLCLNKLKKTDTDKLKLLANTYAKFQQNFLQDLDEILYS